MRYRPATVTDVPAMERARASDAEAGPADARMARYLEGTHHPQQALPSRAAFIALDGGDVVGYIAGHLTRRHDCGGEVQYLYVTPRQRRRGVATGLMRHLARWFVQASAQRVCVNVNDESPGARPFYTRLGATELKPHWMAWNDIRVVVDTRDEALRGALKSQYHAGLAMLRDAIERCPDGEWDGGTHKNAFWQIAYHTLYFTDLYLQPKAEAFRPWSQHQGEVQHEDAIAGPPDQTSRLPLIPRPYTKAQALAYWTLCDEMVDGAVDALDLCSQQCGFHWYQMPKLEHQLVNLRHLQHHTAQLADRVRAAADVGVRWVGGRRAP